MRAAACEVPNVSWSGLLGSGARGVEARRPVKDHAAEWSRRWYTRWLACACKEFAQAYVPRACSSLLSGRQVLQPRHQIRVGAVVGLAGREDDRERRARARPGALGA